MESGTTASSPPTSPPLSPTAANRLTSPNIQRRQQTLSTSMHNNSGNDKVQPIPVRSGAVERLVVELENQLSMPSTNENGTALSPSSPPTASPQSRRKTELKLSPKMDGASENSVSFHFHYGV